MDGRSPFYFNVARLCVGITMVCALMGIIGNSLIFAATIQTKSLRSTYNILIAVCALADVFHQSGVLVQFPFLFGDYLQVDSDPCYVIMFLPEMGIGIGCTCTLLIGLDRMFAIIFSLRYRSLNKRYYHFFIGSMIAAYCAYLCSIMIIFYRKRRVFCEIMAPWPDESTSWFVCSDVLVNLLSVIVYFIIWIGLRSHSDSKSMHRIIKSLFIIVASDVSGWLLTPGLLEFSQHLNLEPGQVFALVYFSIIFVHLSVAIKLPIYYSTSSEYRAAIRSMLFVKSTRVIQSVAAEKSKTSTP